MLSNSKLANATRQKDSETLNGAVTHSTSLNNVLDLFFIAGASRNISEEDLKMMIIRAWVEDPLKTLKVIFWAGDIRAGAGERRFFRIALRILFYSSPKTLEKNAQHIPFFNRWDTLFILPKDISFPLIKKALDSKDGLCAKWMPRKKQYNNFAGAFRSYYKLTPKQYRKLLVEATNVVEQKMCKKQWDEINYSSIPSVAMNKYRKAFYRNDDSRFTQFIDSAKSGKAKINAGVIFPYQLYQAFQRDENKDAIIAQWDQMPNFLEGSTERFLPVCDVSRSMSGLPMDISVSLGVYLSQRNISIFKDAFITFSRYPTMQFLRGDVCERFIQLRRADWENNTDLQKVFSLILENAIEHEVSQDEMPTKVLIISDMEFDRCADLTNYEAIKQKYVEYEYEIPGIIFWNVNGRPGNVPISFNEQNVALVSGASPSIMKSILGGVVSPLGIMNKTIDNERYSKLEI